MFRRVVSSVIFSFFLVLLTAIAAVQPAQAGVTTIPVGTSPTDPALNAALQKVYVTNLASQTLSVIDVATQTVTNTISVTPLPDAVAVANTNTGQEIYVSCLGLVTVINAQTEMITATIPVAGAPRLSRLAVDQVNHKVYVINFTTNAVLVIDEATHTVTNTIPVGSQPFDIAVDESTQQVYVTNSLSNTVSVIDANTQTVVDTIAVQTFPTGVGVNEIAQTVYVTNGTSGTVSVINAASHAIIRTISSPGQPFGVAVDETRQEIFIANRILNKVSVINEGASTVSFTIPVGTWPERMVVDETTQQTYVVNFLSNNVSVIGLPIISTLSPNVGPPTGGTQVTITGMGFLGTTSVTFGGVAGTNLTVHNDTTLTVTTPAHAIGAVDVTVTSPDGTDTKANGFTYLTAPVISGVSPNNGSTAGGTTVTITGSGFTDTTSVTFGGIEARFTVINDNTITVTTPAHAAGTVDITITNPAGTTTQPNAFTYKAITPVIPSTGINIFELLSGGLLPLSSGALLLWFRRRKLNKNHTATP